MAKSYFAILEVTSGATPDEVHSAYRRLAKEYHPDHYEGGSDRFRQIQEAYSVLGDPSRRKAYEETLSAKVRVGKPPGPMPHAQPEPLIPEQEAVDLGEISPVRSFERFTPSFDEIFDWLWDNFSNVGQTKSGRVQNLTLDVPINRSQALNGGNATVMVPARSICPTCQGFGNVGFYQCHRCAGEGAISGEVPVSIAFPAGIVKDHAVVIPLDRFGIRNLNFTVLFRPRDID
jgi:molecular chaperone DnaJ